MKGLGQLFLGLLAAAGSSLIILAAASLALVESDVRPTATSLPPTPTQIQATPAPGETLLPTATEVLVINPTATELRPTACPAPAGWSLYVIQPGDTIESLAELAKIPVDALRQANCFPAGSLIVNSVLFMPPGGPTKTATAPLPTPLPTLPATLTPVPCGPPYGWVLYTVRPGDTIFRLSLAFGISQDMLLRANCMSGTSLLAGQTLFVPNVPTRVPSPTRTPIPPTATAEPTLTNTTAPPTVEPSATTIYIPPTATATATATNTVTPTITPTTPTATFTLTPSLTFTPSLSPTATVGAPTATSTSTP